jgi:hypothetical protein
MGTKKGNMFDDVAAKRLQEVEQMEAKMTGNPVNQRLGRVKKRGAGATTITLSISQEDKELVRKMAEQDGVAISDLFHMWIRNSWKARKK